VVHATTAVNVLVRVFFVSPPKRQGFTRLGEEG